MKYTITHASLQGKRPTNEDELFVHRDKKIVSLCVFDGHGGKFISGYLKKSVSHFVKKYDNYNNKLKIRRFYDKIHKHLIKTYPKEAKYVGSTALWVMLQKNKVLIANTGDCRAVLSRNNLAIALTKDHKPHWIDEKKRITKLKGQIKFDGMDWRIKNLSVSRAFGDLDTYPYITYKPELFEYSLSKLDQFMIIACDGLWDVMTNQEVVHFVLHNKTQTAMKLARYAIKKGSTDNISVIVVFFKN